MPSSPPIAASIRPMSDLTWYQALTMAITVLTAAGLIGGIVIAWVKRNLSGDFAKSSDLAGLSDRMREMERKIELAPTHADLRAVHDRIGGTEKGVAVANAQIESVRESQVRVERDLRLLVEHHLKESK